MSDPPTDPGPEAPDAPRIEPVAVTGDNTQLIRKVGQRSLRATVLWCLASFLCLCVNKFVAIAVLVGAILQLRANFKWLAKTKVLDERERRTWRRRMTWLTALVVVVGLIHVVSLVLPVLAMILRGS